MTNIKTMMKGILFWIAGFIIIVLTNWIVPVLQDAMEIFYTDTEVSAIIWFGALIIWIMLGVIMPVGYVYKGLMEQNDQGPLETGIMGVLIFVFGMIITYKAWFMIQALSEIAVNLDGTTNAFINIIYWSGLLITWSMIVIFAPYRMIIEAYEKGGYG